MILYSGWIQCTEVKTHMMRQPIRVFFCFGILLLAASPLTTLAALQRGGNRIPIEVGEECPPGTTEVRPQQCQAPEMPAPSIVDYRPQSTLVTAEHLVPRAKYPVVDIHGHANSLADPGVIEEMVRELDALNIQVYVAADNMQGERLERTLEAIRTSPHRDRFRVLAGINFGDMEPGWGQRAASEIEAAIEGRRDRRRGGLEEFWPHAHKTGRYAPPRRRSGSRPGLANSGTAWSPGLHSYCRAAGVFSKLPTTKTKGGWSWHCFRIAGTTVPTK